MRTELDHLPSNKQRELERVMQILFEEFNDVQALATGKRKAILKVILYGSYARGGWVDEPHTAKGYQSDFDLLLIVNRQDVADRVKCWSKAEDWLNQELGITKAFRTPVNFIVHTLQEVNDGLAHGRYFFMDVAKDGIALYQADDTELHTPKPKTHEQALKMAKEYFEDWYPSAAKFKKAADFLISESGPREAAFNMHQAAERLYHCALLVCTFYTPHVHNLGLLGTQAERIDMRLIDTWPRDSRRVRAMFEKLKDAYVKARYSKHYRITDEELAWVGERIEELGWAVHAVCSERISKLEEQAWLKTLIFLVCFVALLSPALFDNLAMQLSNCGCSKNPSVF